MYDVSSISLVFIWISMNFSNDDVRLINKRRKIEDAKSRTTHESVQKCTKYGDRDKFPVYVSFRKNITTRENPAPTDPKNKILRQHPSSTPSSSESSLATRQLAGS